MTVQEGETIVIGGLRQQEMSETVSKVPILADIPIMGALFKKKQHAIRHSVLTLFITPHIMRPGQPVPEWPMVDPNQEATPIMHSD